MELKGQEAGLDKKSPHKVFNFLGAVQKFYAGLFYVIA
jgi:hypothetical protein